MSPMLWSAILGTLLLFVIKWSKKKRKNTRPLPPGPPGKPIIGNVSDLPVTGTQDWVHWLKHKQIYGPISSITVMGQTIVILNDIEIAVELLGKRSAKHSSRPNLTFASEMVGWEHILAMQTYSDRFRAYRKAIQPYLGSEQAVAQYNTLQEIESHRFLFRVLQDQTKLAEHIQTEAGAVILKIAYGYTIESHKRDRLIHIANLALEHFSIAGTPGAWLVDMIPALKFVPTWFPGAGFKRKAQKWKRNLEDVADIPYIFVKEKMSSGKLEASYLSDIFKENGCPQSGTEEEIVAKWTSASLYTGGADTTVCAIETFFLAMTLFPEVQRKAQQEIDHALGICRLPKMADRSRLPYVNAVVKEVLRWHPVAPMGIPHMSIEDDIWGEFYIPKGSLIMPNIWAFTHDPETYHNPMSFKPERFTTSDDRAPEKDPRGMVFGFGRRVCPGRFLADNTLYLSIAQSLAVFNVESAKGDADIDIGPKFLPGVISHPARWKFNIVPRSAEHEALINAVEKEHPWQKSDASDLRSGP